MSLLNEVDLAALWNEDTSPDMLVEEFAVRGVHHLLYGPKENGKTMLVLALLVKPLLEAGETVIWIDKEMGHRALLDRLKALRVPRKAVNEHLVYLEMPTLDGSSASRKEWKQLLNDRQPALVVVDAQAGVLAGAGLNENNTPDVLLWDAWYMEPARVLGAATAMIDHTGHEENGRARGASGKGAAAKIEFEFQKLKSFDREHIGKVKVIRRKNTLAADIPAERTFEVGGPELIVKQSSGRNVDFSGVKEPAAFAKLYAVCKGEPGRAFTKKELCAVAGMSSATFDRHRTSLISARGMSVEGDASRREEVRYVFEG